LAAHGVDNLVVDASSIEVNRRARRAKSDAIDVGKPLGMLMRYHQGERDLGSVVNVPAPEDEDRRPPDRDRAPLVCQRTEHVDRIRGLLAALGRSAEVDGRLREGVDALRQWDGAPVPAERRGRIARERERWRLVDGQLGELGDRQRREVRDDDVAHVALVRRLLDLKGVGPVTAWTLVRAGFGWRRIQDRRGLAGPGGLGPGAGAGRRGAPRAGDQQGGEPPRPLGAGGAGGEGAAAPAGIGAEPVVSAAVRVGQRAGAGGGDRGAGAGAGGGAVEVPGAGRGAGGGGDRPRGEGAQRPEAGDGTTRPTAGTRSGGVLVWWFDRTDTRRGAGGRRATR